MSATLKSRLPEIAAELRPKVSAAIKLGAEAVAQDAKSRVPVASGRLREAIHVDHEGPAGYFVVAGDKDAFYGHIVECGGSHSPAQPFLIPALESKRAEIEVLVMEALRAL